jgi:hypothetical protein
MENKKHTIEVGFEELCLIERALELYGRVGMLQFDYLVLCNSLQNEIWKKELSAEFRDKADGLKSVFGYAPNSNPGIFNTEIVGDDCRTAIDMYQTIRHQRYLDRMKENPEEESKYYGTHSSKADTCQMAGMKTPEFKIKE